MAGFLGCLRVRFKVPRIFSFATEFSWFPDWVLEEIQDMVENAPNHPNIWSGGSMEPIPHLDVEVAGAGVLHLLQLRSLTTKNGTCSGRFDGCFHIFA